MSTQGDEFSESNDAIVRQINSLGGKIPVETEALQIVSPILPEENLEDYLILLEGYLRAYAPADPLGRILVSKIAASEWRLRRVMILSDRDLEDDLQNGRDSTRTLKSWYKVQDLTERAVKRAQRDYHDHCNTLRRAPGPKPNRR